MEVISTVSGGSIIGALYYLHVKKRLEDKPDEQITDWDYLEITEIIARDFLAGVQQNPRTLTFADLRKNLEMFKPNYSRSDRLGELYDELFYQPVKATGEPGMIQMQQLKIFPRLPDGGQDGNFNPLDGNAARRNKVPILMLNATTLNDGHNWRFEAQTMGEPSRQGQWEIEIDKNFRLQRPPAYQDMIQKQQTLELGIAVAASACVPGLFRPLAVSDLYPDRIRVQLVDGGVHDNQGVQGLLDMDCRLMVVSDATGQLRDAHDPRTGFVSVVTRANAILMDRVREDQLFWLMKDDELQVALVHLRQGLAVKSTPWIGPNNKPAALPPGVGAEAASQKFGVAPEVQELLSQVRTDLDSFTEVEAYSLMMDAYLMSEDELQRTFDASPVPEAGTGDWDFLKVKPWLEKPTPDYLKQLRVAGQTAFKLFSLNRLLYLGAMAAGAALLVGLWYSPAANWALPTITIRGILMGAMGAALVLLYPRLRGLLKDLGYIRKPAKFRLTFIVEGVMALLAWAFIKVHLKVFDPWFLAQGKIDRLRRPEKSGKK